MLLRYILCANRHRSPQCEGGLVSVTGSTNETDCFPTEQITRNLFAGMTTGGLLTYSERADELEVIEGGAARVVPKSLEFISSSNMLISSFGSDEVSARESAACDDSKHTPSLALPFEG